VIERLTFRQEAFALFSAPLLPHEESKTANDAALNEAASADRRLSRAMSQRCRGGIG
jgi:hypothetical protein